MADARNPKTSQCETGRYKGKNPKQKEGTWNLRRNVNKVLW